MQRWPLPRSLPRSNPRNDIVPGNDVTVGELFKSNERLRPSIGLDGIPRNVLRDSLFDDPTLTSLLSLSDLLDLQFDFVWKPDRCDTHGHLIQCITM